MQFKRVLKQNLISELNNLYKNKACWWNKIVEDEEALILIRNNRLHVLVNGGLLLQINMNTAGKVVCKIHEEFLNLRSETNPYVTITENKTDPAKRVEGLKDLEKHYQKVKRRIKIFASKEKQAVQNIGLRVKNLIDFEIGLEGERKEDTTRKGAQRIDMAGITQDGILVFFEVKLFENSEIRSNLKPRVAGQLKKYQKLLAKYQQEILKGYEDQFKMYRLLDGRFFKRRIFNIGKLQLNPEVRLIVTEFDGSQAKFLLPKIITGIYNGMAWNKKTPNLITVGNPRNIKKLHLFKGT